MNTNQEDPMVLALIPDGIKCRKCGVGLKDNFAAEWRDGERVEGTEQCNDCEDLDRLNRYQENHILTTKLMITAGIKCYEYADGRTTDKPHPSWLAIYDAVRRLSELAKRFDREVWLPDLTDPSKGLAGIVRPSTGKGMASDCKGLEPLGIAKFMTYCIAGRCAIQVEDTQGHFVQIITAEDEDAHRMGLNTIYATAGEATKLLTNVIEAWKAGALLHTDDDKVGIG